MYRKKNFISLGMSLVLAAGITVTPVTAADFTDGTVPEFNSDDATEFDVQQETADNAEFASDTEDSISDKAGSNEADSDEEVFAEAVIPDENGAVDNRQLLEKYLNDILYGQDPDTQPAASLGEDVLNVDSSPPTNPRSLRWAISPARPPLWPPSPSSWPWCSPPSISKAPC